MAEDKWLSAQAAVLGSVLLEPEALAARMLAELGPEDFSDGQLRAIFVAIAGLVRDGQRVDAVTVRDRLGPKSTETLLELMRITPTAANYAAYVPLCREQARLARLRALATELAGAATMDAARALLEQMQVSAAEREQIRIVSMVDAMSDFYAAHQQGRRVYADLGIPQLNSLLLLEPGKVLVLGGYPSAGKSALMLQMARSLGATYRVGIFSFETDSEELMDRTIAHAAGVDFGRIMRNTLSDEDWQRVAARGKDITGRKVDFIPAAGMTVHDVLAITLGRRYQVIFLDYVQEIVPESRRGGTRQEEVAAISMALATMARRHGVLVVELSQLGRATKDRGGTKAPTMDSLRESGQLEQDADAVLLLYRINPERSDSPRELYLAKNKRGQLGKLLLAFDGSTQTFAYDYGLQARYASKPKARVRRDNYPGGFDGASPFGMIEDAADSAALWDRLPGE